YDLQACNIVDPELEKYRGLQLPDVVLIRKSYAEKRRRRKQAGKAKERQWQLRSLAMETDEQLRRGEAEKADMEREQFLEEIEEDPELRAHVQLYKKPGAAVPMAPAPMPATNVHGMDDEEDGDDIPEVPLDELISALSLDPNSRPGYSGAVTLEPAQSGEDEEYDDEDGEGDAMMEG
ncbi:hypothetical protein CYMTET_11787, partial [Cymbomonas tetramitiformis]